MPNYDIPHSPSNTDWDSSTESGIEYQIRTNGDWTIYLPTEENQYRRIKNKRFSVPACTNFSVLNSLEAQANLLTPLMSEEDREKLEKAGFYDGSYRFNCSDAFSAATSGTTENGNSSWLVGETLRKIGCCSEKDWPWKDEWDTFEEYITQPNQEIKEKAKVLLEVFDIKQQIIPVGDISYWLKLAPVVASVPCCNNWFNSDANHVKSCSIDEYTSGKSRHSILFFNGEPLSIFDHYTPNVKTVDNDYPIARAWQLVVTLKNNNQYPSSKGYTWNRDLKLGMRGNDVKMLQKRLKELGFMKYPLTTDYFGYNTLEAVKKYQSTYKEDILVPAGLQEPTGYVGTYTRIKLNT